MNDIPLIDVSGLRSDQPALRAAVAAELGAACREVGFCYVVGHAIPAQVQASVFAAARDFFALPTEAKQRLSIQRSPHNRGYVGLGGERLDARAAPDRKEAFNVGLELAPDHPEIMAGVAFRGSNLWPDLPGWRAAVLAYFDACWALGRLIHRGFAHDLGVAEDFFDDKLDRPLAVLRLLRYPAQMDGTAPAAGEHTDYGNLTILATDGVAGLQVRRRDGGWIDAPHISGALVCNIGDCLMRWTNDVYVSTPHRVAPPSRERYSVAFFLDPNPDARIEVLPSVLASGESARYAPTTGADYLRSRLAPSYAHMKDAG